VFPPFNDASEPTPEKDVPDTIFTAPEVPVESVSPVMSIMSPEFPTEAVPDWKMRSPEIPEVPLLADVI